MDQETQILTRMWQREGSTLGPDVSLGEMKSIPLEIDVRLALSDEQIATNRGRSEALAAIEWGTQIPAKDLIYAFNAAQRLVLAAGVGWTEEQSLFPWIPGYDRNVQIESNSGYLKRLLDLERPLLEQRLNGQNEKIVSIILQSAISLEEKIISEILTALDLYGLGHHRPLFKVEVASIVIESIDFAEGSLWSKIKGKLLSLGIALPLLTPFIGPVVTPPITNKYQEWKFQRKMETQVSGQPCTVYSTWKYDAEALKQASLEAFNFAAPGLSQLEKRSRICNVQLALKLGQGSPDKIDGLWGPASKESLAHFAKGHGVPADIKNEALRGELQQVFWNRKPSGS